MAHQAARDLALVGLSCGEEGGMGAAKAHRHAKTLAGAHGDVGAELAHRRQQHLGQGIHRHGDQQAGPMGGGDHGAGIPKAATGSRQLQQQAKGIGHRLLSARQGAIGARFLSARAGQQGRRIHQLHRNSQGFGPGAQHRQGLGEHVLINQIAPGFAPVGAAAEGHGLGGGGGLIEQGGIGDRQARELANQGLEIEQGF